MFVLFVNRIFRGQLDYYITLFFHCQHLFYFFVEFFNTICYSTFKGGIRLSERLTELRKTLGLSMEKFGSQIGLSRSAISKMESGASGLSEQTLLSICRVFRVNYYWLTEGTGEMFSGTPQNVVDEIAEDYNLDVDDKKLIQKYLELSEEHRKVLKDYFRSVFT